MSTSKDFSLNDTAQSKRKPEEPEEMRLKMRAQELKMEEKRRARKKESEQKETELI